MMEHGRQHARVRANASRNIAFEWFPSALQNEKHDAVEWDGRNVQWWMIDGGVGWRLALNAVFLGGLRIDSFSATLENPHNAVAGQFPPGLTVWYSDFASKVWVPYVGIQISGNNYVARVIGSPFATVQVNEPVSVSIFRANSCRRKSTNSSKYSLTHGGGFLEFSRESSISIASMANLSVWGELSWARFRGNGHQSLDDATFNNNSANGVALQDNLSQHPVIDYGWSSYAIGLATNLFF
jgi:hypothetical protein